MRLFNSVILFVFLMALIIGCSSGGSNSPVVPAAPSETPQSPAVITELTENPWGTDSNIQQPAVPDVPGPDSSPLADTETNEDGYGVLSAGSLMIDPVTQTITDSPDRDPMININVTGYLKAGGCPGGCFRYRLISVTGDVYNIDVTIENPTTILAFDVRLIFTALGKKTIVNADGYTDLFDPAGTPYINPFIAFGTDYFLRLFPTAPGGIDTQNLKLKWPANDNGPLRYIVTASLPENTQEPYTIEQFQQLGSLWWQGGECNLAVWVDDWQWDITSVLVDARLFNNQIMYLVSNPERPNTYEVHVVNTNNVYPGTYPTLFKATSPNPQNISMYNIFNVVVTGPIQNPPVCDFYVQPDQINVGETTWLHPGTGISDPDGNAIVLYEFDYYYNDGVFNVMASNTTGAAVETPPAPYLGPNPVQITMALRITDNGVPPMSKICTDILTVNSNQAPVCDLTIVPMQIKSGQTTQLSPGPNCKDPDGSITLYEYDFNYDGTTFTADASNTTGATVTTTAYNNPGPNPLNFTIGMRVTDNGNPQRKTICSKQITVVANQAPVCDLKVDPLQIASGQTTTLSPGTNCKDPDGTIVLYEYDFDYNGTTFNVDASNTTGAPVVTTAYFNPGPGPLNVMIGMRVTDNGAPVLKSTCTKNITVVSNQSPTCELILSDYDINSGASVDCQPGPGTIDPDGAIVLYEYDFDYDNVTFTVDASNTTGAVVATGPIDNTTGNPVTRHIAMRVTDNATTPIKVICTKDLVIQPIMTANNPWRNPAVRVTPNDLAFASVNRDYMENNLVVYGQNVYVCYFGQMQGGDKGYFIQRSTNGGVTFNAPQNLGYPADCWVNNMDKVAMDVLANGWVATIVAGFHDGCTGHPDGALRFRICKPNASGGVDMMTSQELQRCGGSWLWTDDNEGVQSIDLTAHPTDPNICFVDAIDLDRTGGGENTDDVMLFKITNCTTTPSATMEFTCVPNCAGAYEGSGEDKAHIDAVADYNGNLHVVFCSRDLGTIYYSMIYGNTAYPFQYTPLVQVNRFGEQYPEGAHVAIDRNNKVYITYAATGIPGEIAPQEIGMLSGVGYPPTFPDPPFILNHDRAGNQVYPDIEFDQTNDDLWVAYTTYAYGPGQITFELYDAVDGWTQFTPDYFVNKDDQNNQHDDQNVHLFFVSSTATAYAIWEETNGPNSPHLYFNRTH